MLLRGCGAPRPATVGDGTSPSNTSVPSSLGRVFSYFLVLKLQLLALASGLPALSFVPVVTFAV